MPYKSKCTCAHRHPSQNVRAWNLSHSEDCYYYEKLKEEHAQQRAMADFKRLYSYYSRKNKEG
jgi:hypothetical protein